MKNIIKIEPINTKNSLEERKNVCAYARVSTKAERQSTSLDTQIKHYKKYIKENDDWNYMGIYVDNGISGKATKSRVGFNKMIKDCEDGKIDLIITKSISRFARNTVDALQNIRKLKNIGIPIIFEKENINTMDNTGELLITILSSQAQEESRNISENIRWGIKRRYENGIFHINTNLLLGYTKNKDGKIIIDEEEAKIIRRIYREYLEGKSCQKLADELRAEGINTVRKSNKWSASGVSLILKNEKYIGDVRLQKTYNKDFLDKKRRKNKGDRTSYYVKDNHPAIVSKEVYNKVQEELARRTILKKKGNKSEKVKSKYSSKYALTELLKCDECGKPYRRQVWSKNGDKMAVWRCECRLKNGVKSPCKNSPTLHEKALHQGIMQAMNKLRYDEKKLISELEVNVNKILTDSVKCDDSIRELQEKMFELVEKQAEEGIENASLDDEYKKISDKIKKLKTEKKNLENSEKIEIDIHEIDKKMKQLRTDLYEYDESLVKAIIEEIKVRKDMNVDIKLKLGVSIKSII